MNMHFSFQTYETGPPGNKTSTAAVNITLLGNLAAAGSLKSLYQLQLLAQLGNADAKRELKSISHLLPHATPKDNNNAKPLK